MYKHTNCDLNTLDMKYSEVTISEELNTRLSILNMIYSVVKPLSNDVIYCEQDDSVTVVNRNGIEIMSGTKDTLKTLGAFLVILDKDISEAEIYCFSTNRHKKIKYKNSYGYELKQVGQEFLIVSLGGYSLIFNKYLDEILNINTYKLNAYEYGDSRICIKYRLDLLRESTGFINRLTGKVTSYDSFDLNDNYTLLATDYHENKGITINKDCIEYFKYKLVKDNIIVSNKSYEDITKPSELNSTDTFYIFDLDERHNRKVGLLRGDGVEMLEPIYDEIRYIGANNYILDIVNNDRKYTAIYNSDRGVVYNFDELISAEVHKTLPIVLIARSDGEFRLLTTTGTEIKLEELPKYFKCSYSEQRTDIIRVDLGYSKKYITNTLVPITNIHEIAKLSTHNWIPMYSD